ncbi:MAG: response regulator transcription factor [Pirellulaceae bacterium]|nr:response regulator transcription factor [Pirellulaceae bacterium]
MTYKALVVDDDPEILDAIGDILVSLEHGCDRVDSVEAARTLLDKNQYDYVLLDLEIPVRAGRNFPRIQNGLNLLQQIVKQRGAGRRPGVIVITAHGNDGPELGVEVMKSGADDHVSKPFKAIGKTLDKCILELLAKLGVQVGSPARSATTTNGGVSRPPLKNLERGTMAFFDDHVEFHGLNITSGRSSEDDQKALRAFAERLGCGNFKSFTGRALAKILARDVDEMSGYIRNLRGRITKHLARAGFECGPEDVIAHGDSGYHFTELVSVQPQDRSLQGKTATPQPNPDPANVPGSVPASVPTDADGIVPARRSAKREKSKAARVQWLREQFAKGTELRAPALAAEWGCSDRTIKRDIATDLADEVEFSGPTNSGRYCLKHKKPR